MFAEHRRKKKLIVAFHFQFANQAGWKCDGCRRAGLDGKRRCGWQKTREGSAAPVWARSEHAISECPKSYITASSQTLLEEFNVWKLFGGGELHKTAARSVEAICILEEELRREAANRNERSRN